MDDVYKTIQDVAEGLYKDKGSRFIAFAYPVRNEDEIKELLTVQKEKYYDARHHCYAYILGADKKRFRANDDGEPSSTAGRPILGQILSNDLTDVLIIVVRYFGGIKLGVSGLINAYREAAAEALRNAVIIEKTVEREIQIRFSYLAMNDVMRIIKEEGAEIRSRDFALECNMTLSIRERVSDTLLARLSQVGSVIFPS